MDPEELLDQTRETVSSYHVGDPIALNLGDFGDYLSDARRISYRFMSEKRHQFTYSSGTYSLYVVIEVFVRHYRTMWPDRPHSSELACRRHSLP